MVVTLARMKWSMMRHNSNTRRVVGALAGLGGILLFISGHLAADSDAARSDLMVLGLASLLAGWVLGPILSPKAGILRPHDFALLPLSRWRLGAGLMAVCFIGIGPLVTAAAMGTVIWWAAGLAPQAILVAIPGAILTLILIVVVSRLAYALLGTAMLNRLGVEIAAIQYGLLLSTMFVGWMIFQIAGNTIGSLLESGLPGTMTRSILEWVPSTWTVHSIEAAAAGQWTTAVAWLCGLAALTALLAAITVLHLVPKTHSRNTSFGARRRGRLSTLLPSTPLGAVIGKETRQWARDPWRVLEMHTGWWTGLIAGGLAWVAGYVVVAPFAALITAFMAALVASNLYGHDGTALWQLASCPGKQAVRADVRGRQIALLLWNAPAVAVILIVFTAGTGQHWAWPYMVAGSTVLLLAGLGVSIFLAVIAATPGVDPQKRVGPNDTGDLQFQVWMAMWMMPVSCLPTVFAGVIFGIAGAPWLITIVALVNGIAVAWIGGRLAHQRLRARLPETFARLRYGKEIAKASAPNTSLLDKLESSAINSNKQLQVGS
ncbi:hypothetical protein [Natronoglycomyces albus]|uniref:ABC-2 type transport system permease protein n=1 Tax=Natronoglycomyces albus TaxID=2811108 RepID=A0A895XMF8_9ACTN|nr:hypothetical protein [Natronoglycomyces albus]QSB06851.1 hypothetical protein JQS30_08190 [Natronoglycomyces albus]